MRLAKVVPAVGMIAAIVVVAASADGLPVLGIDVGSSGVTVPGASVRYVTVQPGGSTIVAAISRDGGQIVRYAIVNGSFTIPAVAYDGSASGLSADRRTLVLIEPRRSFPRARTKLLVLHTKTLRRAGVIDLRGDFSFDAVSPDGSRVYLIQYTNPADPTRYLVRSYDVKRWRLDPRPIVDPREATEKMRGNPISRATSAGLRLAYTLYDGGGAHPFIHALDTARSTARCIDLDDLPAGTHIWDMRLHVSRDGRTLAITDRDRTVLALAVSSLAPGD